jgi:hypothetical protein
MRKHLLTALFCLIFSPSLLAETEDLVTSELARGFAHRVMMDISRGKLDHAWRKIKANSSIPAERIDAFASDYNRRLVDSIQFFGPSVGVELIDHQEFGRSIMRVTYLVKYDITGVAWFLYFYRKNDRWVLSEFNYDLNSNSLFTIARSGAESGDQLLVWRTWQDAVEKRLAKLEQGGGARAYQIDPSQVDTSDASATFLLQMDARLRGVEDQLSALEQTDTRLAEMEKKYDAILRQYEAITYQIDMREIAKIQRTLAILKDQHPFVAFPK